MWWLHRHPEGLESDLRAKICQNGISSGIGRQDLKFLVCYLSEGRNLLLNTRNNSGDSPSLGTSSPTISNGLKRSGNFSRVANSGLARMSVANPSQIGRMSLGMDVSQSQVTLEIDQEWQLLPNHTGGT